jgi:putative transposase
VNRSLCFRDDFDRQRYLGLLKDYAAMNDCVIHAYVLMGNHVHLLMTPERDDGLSRTMKGLGERYVPFYNRRHGRTGTLWEGRFRSNVVQDERYLFKCQTYIELNPLRAQMVEHPAQYAWSSYRSNASGAPAGIITPHERYLALGLDEAQRSRAYRALFEDPASPKDLELIREAVNAGYALGDEAFIRRLAAMKGVAVTRRKPGPPRGASRKENGADRSAPRQFGVCPLFE